MGTHRSGAKGVTGWRSEGPRTDPWRAFRVAQRCEPHPKHTKHPRHNKYFRSESLRSSTQRKELGASTCDRELCGDEGSRTLATNHMVQIIYAPRERQDAQEYSEILGYYGLSSTSKGRSSGRGAVTSSENTSDQKRALMLPQELREIGPRRVIVMADNCKPIFGDKIEYFSDPVFMERLLPPVKVPSLDIDAFIAKSEGRMRNAVPGEQVLASRLAVNLDAMPSVSNTAAPLAQEVSAMADWLFSNVQWTQENAHDKATPDEPTLRSTQILEFA